MAVLPEADRIAVVRQWMRDNVDPTAFDKAALRAAGDYTDVWQNDNQASYNNGLPEPFKSTAMAQQKTVLFCYVALRRAGLLKTAEDG